MSVDELARPRVVSYGLYWNPVSLAYEPAQQGSGTSGGGDASAANQLLGNASLSSIDGKVATAAKQDLQTTALNTLLTQSDFDTKIGSLTEAAPASDTASSGLNGRLQRIAQNITSLIAKLPAVLGAGGGLKIDGSGTALPVSGTFWQAETPVTRTIATNGAIASVTTAGTGTVTVAITGVWVGALLFFGIDGAGAGNAIYAVNAVTGQPETSITANGVWLIPSAGWSSVGLTSTSWTSGTASFGFIPGTRTNVVALARALPTGANIIGALVANQSTNVNQFGGNAVATGVGASGVGVPRVTVANDSNVLVTPPTLTKGTQGATGFSTQDLKDAGRNQTNFYMVIQIVTTATDALMALTGFKAGATVAATTTPAVVTAGKTYRINSITLEYTSIVTTEGSVRFTLRAQPGGVVLIGSPAVAVWEIGQTGSGVSVAGKKNTIVLVFPDGIEFAAGTGIGLSQVGLSPTGAAAIAGYGRATINGYEY